MGGRAAITDICILDTSALKNAADIEIAGRHLIEWTSEMMDAVLPEEVIGEVTRKHQADPDVWEKAYRVAMRTRRVGESGESLDFFDNWVKRHRHPHGDLQLKRDLGKGERGCAALALGIAGRRRKGFLNFTLIDDKARNTLNEFYRRQGVGIAIATPDLILLILNRNRIVTRTQALGAVNDFYTENQDRKMDALKPGYVADINSCWRKSATS